MNVVRGEMVEKDLTAFMEKRGRQGHRSGDAWQLILGGEA